MKFGTSYLEEGEVGGTCPGHNRGKEVFYCALGKVIVEFSEESVELNEGDAVIIPKDEPHKLINKFKGHTLIVWSLAPPDEKTDSNIKEEKNKKRKLEIIRKSNAKEWYEADELCHLYRKDEYMEFGTSYIKSGKAGAVDSGHNSGKEVFYCAIGKVAVEFSKEKIELNVGDAVVIPIDEPHKLVNKFDQPTLIVWSLVPPDKK
jgi:quercetin dioxygenase-like cupin family protein